MFTNTQVFFKPVSATGAVLTCEVWSNFHQLSTGAFCLVGELMEKGTPTRIVNLFRKDATRQSFDVQSLDRNQVIVVDQMSRNFMLKVGTLITDFLVNGLQYHHGLLSTYRAFYSSGYTPLSNTKFSLGRLVVSGIINLRSIRQSGKGFNARVQPDNLVRGGQCANHNAVTRYNGEPLHALTLDRNLFDDALDFTVLSNFEQANVRKTEFAVHESEALTIIEKAIKERFAFESWVARLFTRFNTAKERLKRFIDLTQHLTAYARWNLHIVRIQFANVGDLFNLVEARYTDAVQSPSITTLLDSAIIQISAQIKGTLKIMRLLFVGIYPKFIGLSHS